MSRIGTLSALTGHRFGGIVGREGKGFTPPPWVGVTGTVVARVDCTTIGGARRCVC